jgi:hypothetical protein
MEIDGDLESDSYGSSANRSPAMNSLRRRVSSMAKFSSSVTFVVQVFIQYRKGRLHLRTQAVPGSARGRRSR